MRAVALLTLLAGVAHAETVVLRFATPAPEGTAWAREGYAFQRRAAEVGFKQAVRERDAPFGDYGQGPRTA